MWTLPLPCGSMPESKLRLRPVQGGLDRSMRAYRAFSQAPWLDKILDLQDLLLQTFSPAEPSGKILPEVAINRQQQIESEQAIARFSQTCHATRVAPSRTELEEVWAACRGLSACHVAACLVAEITGAEDWRPRLRMLHLLEFLHRQGGAAAIVADETLSEIEELLRFLSKEVPQCRAIACHLLCFAVFTELEEVPRERSSCQQGPDCRKAMSRPSSTASSDTDVPADLPEVRHLDRGDEPEVPALPPPRLPGCPTLKATTTTLPEKHETKALAPSASWEAISPVQEVLLPDELEHDSAKEAHDLASPGARSLQDMAVPEEHVSQLQRPYLWLAAVGAVQMESVMDPFAEFELPSRVVQI
ncbi:unnamed protein product [Symbiodinium sp. CCMP2456]|nr:unnamed protein product [Symbiodinium sp. CCMP2456]